MTPDSPDVDGDRPDRPGFFRRHDTALGAAGILLIGLGVRVALAAQNELGLTEDTDFFLAWTRSLVNYGLGGFYESTRFCDYPPLFLLIMWGIGQTASMIDVALSNDHLLRALLKAPACLADLAIAVTLLIEGRRLLGGRRALGAAALYFLNPVSVYNSAYWGQVDAIHTACVLLGIVFVSRKRWALAGGALALAMLQKFQSIAFLPLLFFDAYYFRRWRGVGAMLIGATVVAAWVCTPFAISGTLDDVLSRAYVKVVGQYHSLTPSAFNVWQLTGTPDADDTAVPYPIALAAAAGRPTFVADGSPLLWLTWRHVSLLAYALFVALILSIYSYRPRSIARAGAAGLLGLAFFLIPTEMHERYAHPAIAFLALWAVTGPWRERAFFVLSALLLLNLTVVLPADDIAMHIAGSLVLLFLVLLVWVGIGRHIDDLPTRGRAPHVPPDEPAPPPSRVVTWFRRATYLAVCAALVGSAAIGYACRDSFATLAEDRSAYLSAFEPTAVRQSWGHMRRDRGVLGGPIRLGDVVYMRGLGTHAPSELTYNIPGGFKAFKAIVGVDGSAEGKGSALASVTLDGRTVFETPLLTGRGDPVEVFVPLNEARRITLRTSPTPDGTTSDHVSWALARFD